MKRIEDLTLRQQTKGSNIWKSTSINTVYSEAFFAKNYDLSSQHGYMPFLNDKQNNFQPLFWTSYKSKRSTHSALGSGIMFFADAFDMVYTFKYEL